MTRVLVLGRNGQLARALSQTDWPAGWDVVFAGRDRLDLEQLDTIAPFIREAAADVVINTAAFTAVDRAELDTDAALRLNAEAPDELAKATQRVGGLLIHLSTDYVFGGAGRGPYGEDAPTAPVNSYGRTKAQGEMRVLAAAPDASLVRTAWLMSPGSGFLAAILGRAARGETVSVVDDQLGNPTLTTDLAAALVRLASDRLQGRGRAGRLHIAGPLEASWYDFACAALKATVPDSPPRAVLSADYVLTAQRPRDSRLSVMRLQQNHDIDMRPWPVWVAETARCGLNSAANRVEIGQQSGG